MDELAAVLDDLHDLLSPVVNSGASRDQLHVAARQALEIVEAAYAELGIEDVDEEELEDEDEDDEEDELEDDSVQEGEEEPGEHVQL